jgi:hypothetical protein
VAVAGATVLAAGLAGPAADASTGARQAAAGPVCSAVTSSWKANAAPDAHLTTVFGDYGNTGKGWTGADSTYSLPRPGRTLWVFSDTFLGPVNDDLSRPTSTPLINNSFVVQHRGDRLRTITGGTPNARTALLPPPSADSWYWLGAPSRPDNHHVDVFALRFHKTGSGSFDFAWAETKLARFSADGQRLEKLLPVPSAHNIEWASWVSYEHGWSYVYGVEDLGLSKYMHVARVHGRDLTGTWQFWTGAGWSDDEADSARVMPGVANEYGVSPFHDGYLLVTHDTNELFSSKVVGYFSCAPTGPFVHPVTLYNTPETGANGSYGNGNIITYNTHEHPDLRRGNRLLVTYNVNSLDPNNDLYDDVTIYRPRFIDVRLTETPIATQP